MQRAPSLVFSIDRAAKTPVFEQICTAIRTRAISGELVESTKLPPTRVFATELGVSRSTVVTAYEQLVAEGYLQGLPRSGYTVCAIGEVERLDKTSASTTNWHEEMPPPVPFEAGLPDMQLFPHRQWAKAVARICRENPQAMLVGGSVFGNLELRKAISAHVSEWRGIDASPHQTIITAGSADALEICMRTLAQRGDHVGLENPGYLPVRHFAATQGLSPSFLDIGTQGAELPDGGPCPRFVILTPSHQFPLGGAMSPNRRLEFIHWAKTNDTWIIEDDYDSEFRYAGRPIPAMAGFDQLDRTIYVGSFSKIFSNSLRLGYLIVPDTLLELFRATIKNTGPKASFMPQQALAEFISSGEFYKHLRRVRRIYGERRKFLVNKLSRDFADLGSFEDHQAGMQIVFHLNEGLNDVDVSHRAAENGITVRPLSGFSALNQVQNGLILGFCGYSESQMRVALSRLKTCIEQK